MLPVRDDRPQPTGLQRFQAERPPAWHPVDSEWPNGRNLGLGGPDDLGQHGWPFEVGLRQREDRRRSGKPKVNSDDADRQQSDEVLPSSALRANDQ